MKLINSKFPSCRQNLVPRQCEVNQKPSWSLSLPLLIESQQIVNSTRLLLGSFNLSIIPRTSNYEAHF